MSDTPLVYIVFGAPNSGRREVIFDLIEGGIAKTSEVLLFHPEGEPRSPFDEKIEAIETVSKINWSLKDAKVTHGNISAAPEVVIFLAPGTSDPSDIAEALKSWIDHNSCELGRILTVVNCALLQDKPAAQTWYDACIHFSDAILLNRRENNDNKWVKEFELHYQKQCSPARFILVKKGRVPNPAEILNPEARRRSLYFDELIPIEEDGLEEAEQPEDIKPDKYIERLENGQRAHKIPNIEKYL
ncbi:MAG: hypothetical protein ACN4GF_09935 [Lentimonas sp.]